MIRLDDKVIDLVEKICRALKDGRIGADAFPMDEILNLIAYYIFAFPLSTWI